MQQFDSAAVPALHVIEQLWLDEPEDHASPASEEAIEAAERELGVRFPLSYRAFLRRFGTGSLNGFQIFGIPGDRLWGDVVMMNQLASRHTSVRYVRFMEDVGDYIYCLDTGRIDDSGECPVLIFGPMVSGKVVAPSFPEFVRLVKEGLIG
jgi:antitoxin YobK